MVEVLPPLQWAQRQFGQTELGDVRRTQRAVIYAAAAARTPSQSVPQQCGGDWKQTKGAYRLFDMPEVSFDKLQEPHRRQTLAAASAQAVALWISDTTTLSFDHPATGGLGPTSASGSGQGMLLHTTMAVDVSGGIDQPPAVLGLGFQQLWVRGLKPNRTKPESSKWAAGVEGVGMPPKDVRWVHVGDRESDCWEAIDACRGQGCGFALRACQNRLVISGHASAAQPLSKGEPGLLFDLLGQSRALGTKKLWVRGRKDRQARWARLSVSALPVTLLAPQHWSEKAHRQGLPRPEPVECWAVRVCEVNAPPGEARIEWVILTDEPVKTLAAALKVVFWYSCRWLIEEYHKCLKTGCRIESRQLEEAARLKTLLGILSVVAVRLLQLKHQAKVNPDAPATTLVPAPYVKTLAAHLQTPVSKMTMSCFWRETARLGGFLGRKGDGDPGWLTLWRGWEHLEILAAGVELGRGMK
jgi:Transposase DNA-binding/Transposase Tn5 dimerisation domain